MTQRNGQNPIRAARTFEHGINKANDVSNPHNKTGATICPACKAEVPLKPGFRLSAIKCPKCGTSMGKK